MRSQRFVRNKMLNSGLKKLILTILLVTFLFQASSVFALEIKYPPVPGALTPNQIEEQVSGGTISKGDSLPLLINYFLRLFFVIAISIAITIIIYGGVLYLISGAKPAVLVIARMRISQGLLGLLILVCSYLILAVINPQLLVFKIEYPSPQPVISLTPPLPTNQITFLQIPFGTLLENTLRDLDETTTTAKWGKVHRIEVPLLEIISTLSETVTTTENLMTALKKCQCGISKWDTEWNGLKGKCIGGMKEENKKNFLETLLGKPWEEIGELIKGGQNVCLTRCEDCGTDSACDLRNIKVKRDETTGKIETIEIETSNTDKTLKPITDNDKKISIKYNRMRLQELLAELQTQKIKLSTEQITLIEKTLGGNVGNFLISGLLDIKFQEDFFSQQKALESQGYEVNLERPKQFPEAQTITMSLSASDPFTFYAPLEGELIAPPILKENQRVYRESQRASLFAVLTQLSLEDIEQMIQDCLSSAFGQGEFLLDKEEFLKIVEETIKEGAANWLGEALSENSLNLTEEFIGKLREGINGEFSSSTKETDRIRECKTECETVYQSQGLTLDQCNKKCESKTIPVNFLSNKLVEVLTTDIRKQLPKEIQTTLREELKDFILSTTTYAYYSEDIIKLIDPVLQGALSKTLEEQIPFLRENLQKRMIEILPTLVLDPLQTVDAFLTKHLKDLNKRVDAQIAEVVMKLGEALSKPAIGVIEDYKERNPEYFTENLPKEDCRASDGRYYDDKTKKCITPTPEQINDNWESTIQGEKAGWVDKPTFCRSYAKYDWDPVEQKCVEPRWIDIEGIRPTWENARRLGREFVGGLVNFAEQFLVALTQTSVYTLTKYAQVWVEDEIITPLQPYLQQLTDFQKKLQKFLSSTIKDLLPQQIATYLGSNIDQILADICRKSTAGQSIKLYQGMDQIDINPDVGKAACTMEKELHKSLLDKLAETGDLGKEIVKALHTTVYDLLKKGLCSEEKQGQEGHQCVLDYLDKSPAEILWPGLTNIKELITGTPKQFICGELMTDYQPEKVKIAIGEKSIFDKCQEMKTTARTAGLIPYLDQTNPLWQAMSGEKREAYLRHCYFIWYACQNPFAGWNQTIGKVIEKLFTTECNRINGKVANECNGVNCYAGCEKEDLSNNLNFECESCKVLVKNSVAFTLFKYGIEENYGLIKPVDNRTNEEKEEEIETYQWLVVVFPDLDLEKNVDRLAKERDLWQKWALLPTPNNSPRQEAIDAEKLNDLPVWQQKGDDFARAFVAWFTENRSVYDILTYPSFGIMRYLKGENYQGRNFLARTPYQLLHDDLCVKVIKDYQTDYRTWTIEEIKRKEVRELGRILPYSMQALELPITTAEALGILSSLPESEVPWDRREQYITCKSLDYTPAQILGLDQKLIRYVRPKEYQILFALIKDQLKSYERPEALNNLLNYLYGDTPVSLLAKVGTNLRLSPDPETRANGEDMILFANFLNTKIGDQINQGPMREQIIVLIFRALGKEGLLYQRFGWQEWKEIQELLSKTPVDLIELFLNQPLISDLKIIRAPSIMDRIAANSVLGERYVDTLGRSLHLTEPISEFFIAKDKLDEKINSAVRHTRAEIQNTFDKVLLEYPKQGLIFLGRALGRLLGIKLGEKTAGQMAGGCREASATEQSEKKCLDPEKEEVYKIETKECCSLGEGLVCAPRCRKIEEGEECKTKEGETEEIKTETVFSEQEEVHYCCFSQKCQICREPKTTDGTIKCAREGETATRIDSLNLCCKERIKKDDVCCVNIMQCIVDKFTFHLELLGDVLIDGPPLNELSK